MTNIGENAHIKNSIIGRHTTINSTAEEPSTIRQVSVIADDVVLEAGSNLEATKIYPHQQARGNFQNQTLLPT